MPYIEKKFSLQNEIKAWAFLVKTFDFSMGEAQRIIDRKQLFCNDNVVQRKSDMICGHVTLLAYEPNPKGLIPIYENDIFAVFEKPSGVLTHPRNRHTEYSLNDEIKYLYGRGANVVHRLDKETSGLIVVSKNKKNEGALKSLFSQKEVRKKYDALVRGKITEEIRVEAPILANSEFSDIKLKVYIDESGKRAETIFQPLRYFEDLDATLVRAIPKTGRQHQIRVHLFHVEHSIIGDPLYGLSTEEGTMYLDGKMEGDLRVELTGAPRLLLHASEISFRFQEVDYSFKSSYDNEREFYALALKNIKR